jgi:predicted ATP-grasp superfamily ATP-dependent carboligase
MRDRESAKINNIIDEIVTDGKMSVKPITSTVSVANERQYHDRTGLNEPTIIVAFPGPGMVGSITANYIIERLHMHEIAFRVYANNDGTICVILCEIPILVAGIYSVLNTIVKWTVKCNSKEVIVLGGFPVEGIPGPDRKTLILSTDNIKAAYADDEVQPIEDNNSLVSCGRYFSGSSSILSI